MRPSRFTEAEIASILDRARGGVPIDELCREHGISISTYYIWRTKFGRPEESRLHRMKKREAENALVESRLLELTKDNSGWGFERCFRHLRKVEGRGWNHKRVYRIYRELGLHLRFPQPPREEQPQFRFDKAKNENPGDGPRGRSCGQRPVSPDASS